jgi:hypothetical protein
LTQPSSQLGSGVLIVVCSVVVPRTDWKKSGLIDPGWVLACIALICDCVTEALVRLVVEWAIFVLAGARGSHAGGVSVAHGLDRCSKSLFEVVQIRNYEETKGFHIEEGEKLVLV